MALIKCAECGKETNDAKKQCTNCGYKNKLNIDMYLKYDTTNTKKCIKCGNVLNQNHNLKKYKNLYTTFNSIIIYSINFQ